jgi:hypothetical protein
MKLIGKYLFLADFYFCGVVIDMNKYCTLVEMVFWGVILDYSCIRVKTVTKKASDTCKIAKNAFRKYVYSTGGFTVSV